jgi:predicted nucleic acid-binding protein
MQEELQALPWVVIDEEVERRALDAQGRLARTGHHRISPADVIIAALADHHELGVLHYDSDFEHILERTGLRFESVWLAERGTL